MDDRKMVEIVSVNGSKEVVELITYLISDDKLKQYIVYSKGEVRNQTDHVIYISRLFKSGNEMRLEEISDDAEWLSVQRLLKKIANVN